MHDMDAPSNMFRLNYSVTSEDAIIKGIDLLSEVVKKYAVK